MNKKIILQVLCAGLFLTAGCEKDNADLWDGSKTAGRFRKSNRDFWGHGQDLSQSYSDEQVAEVIKEEFIPLNEEDLMNVSNEIVVAQSIEEPGALGSSLPSLDHFRSPTAALQTLFQNLYFYTDEYVLKGEEQTQAVKQIAQYLQSHADIYITVSGHCDARGPQAYNFSLGAKRANHIRSLLVDAGIDQNRIFTISYGKEQPISLGNTPQDWAKNRRAEFKIFDKKAGS